MNPTPTHQGARPRVKIFHILDRPGLIKVKLQFPHLAVSAVMFLVCILHDAVEYAPCAMHMFLVFNVLRPTVRLRTLLTLTLTD